MINDTLRQTAGKMDRTVEVAAEEFAGIRTGRANAGMFSGILIDYYGAPTPLQQLASITIPEARTVLVTPYDKSAMAGIERTLRDSDIGANPSDDGTTIRLVLPELTSERRREYVKLAHKKAEEARVAVRACRHKAREQLGKLEKSGEAGEDQVARAEKELESITKKHIARIDDLLSHKEAELLEV
ncbi:MAG: ribosome recycling factor [Bifidobacteriaceae bacterium]|jgi:ribosome recycling factor|nr:ribosome recycling factor [Bifidobacteriaceae bacterium]